MSEDKPDKFFFTVSQLIEILKTMPQDLPVLVSGYKNGYENFFHPCVEKMKHEPENTYYDGEFQRADKSEKDSFDAVTLQRVMRYD